MAQNQTVSVQHIVIDGDGSIGWKLNQAIRSTNADIYVRFDDDDLYENDYVVKCVEALENCELTGLSSAYFTDSNKAWLYAYKGGQPYVIGSGSAFKRSYWERNNYRENVTTGEDLYFCGNGIIKPHNYLQGFVALIHGDNTASNRMIPVMQSVSLTQLPERLYSAYLK